MKKTVFSFLCALFLLSSCNLPYIQKANDDALSTKVAEIIASSVPPATLTPILVPTQTSTETPTATLTATPIPSPIATDTPEPTNTPVVVTSEAMVVTAAPSQASPAPTLNANDYRNRLGEPSGTDPMTDPTLWNWPAVSDIYTSAVWTNGQMNLTGLKGSSGWRMPYTQPVGNMYLEMTINSGTCSGDDSYGIIFRIPELEKPNQGYLFGINCDGRFGFWKWDGRSGKDGTGLWLIQWKASDAILPGANKVNRIGVLMIDNSFTFYANGIRLGDYKDTTFKSGYFGAFVNPKKTNQYTVGIQEVNYWLNAQP